MTAGALAQSLAAVLTDLQARAAADPFSNPILRFALELTRRLDSGEISLDDLDQLVQDLSAEALSHRASRLRTYLGEVDAAANRGAISGLIEQLAAGRDFESFRELVEQPGFGVVFTGHPTFSMPLEVARALTELATGQTTTGATLEAGARERRLLAAHELRHQPPAPLTLEAEREWSIEALQRAHEALESVHRIVLNVAKARWPQRWSELTPCLMTLATWVGYDQDGRTDVTSMRSLAIRMADKRAALERYRAAVEALTQSAGSSFNTALEPIRKMLCAALDTVGEQSALLADAESDPRHTARFARAMVAGRDAALVEIAPLVNLIDNALRQAPDDERRAALLLIRANLRTHGMGLAHVHVRLNSSQLHNAIRRQVGLETEPNDPANRRSYFNVINDLIGRAQPVSVNFGSLMREEASAKRLMMTLAQSVKFIDARTPVRFLIAETETGFTLLTALYYARLFGIDGCLDISPLFETEEAFERGERVVEEALKSPHYRAYLRRQGRIALQFGYSDSGRFIGQMAATFRIERLKLRLAQLLEHHGLADLEVILFDTHGESIGRGGHPATIADRLRYVAPPMNRAEFEARSIRVKEEVSFQGGEGFLSYLTPAAALACLRQIIDFLYRDDADARNDPIYAAPDYAAEFFATAQQEFTSLIDDPGFAALLGLFGTNLLYQTGSRPAAREAETQERAALLHPSQLRAIPANAILQQLGFLANTLYGVGQAASKDPEILSMMQVKSARFRRALQMVVQAQELSDLAVLAAYARIVDPGMWLILSGRTRSPKRAKALRELARLTEQRAGYDRIARVIRRLQGDYLRLAELLQPANSARRDRLMLLHAIRIAVIQRICILAADIPNFSAQRGLTRDGLVARIIDLDVAGAVQRLAQIFPKHAGGATQEDFGEAASYRPESALSYGIEHATLLEPLLRLHDLARRIGSAINYEAGAIG